MIVFDDADLDALVATLTETGYYNSGQDCTAPCRVIAGPGVFDGVVSQLTESAAAVKTGDPLDGRHRDGPGRVGRPARARSRHGRPARDGGRRGDHRRERPPATATSTSRRSS